MAARIDGGDAAGSKAGGAGGEVCFEFTTIGGAVRVAAIDVATGLEVTAVAPAGTALADLERLALGKLRRRLAATAVPRRAATLFPRDRRSRTV